MEFYTLPEQAKKFKEALTIHFSEQTAYKLAEQMKQLDVVVAGLGFKQSEYGTSMLLIMINETPHPPTGQRIETVGDLVGKLMELPQDLKVYKFDAFPQKYEEDNDGCYTSLTVKYGYVTEDGMVHVNFEPERYKEKCVIIYE